MTDRAMARLLDRIRHEPRLSREDEAALLERDRLGDASATAALVMSHLRFVLHLARRYRRDGHPWSELVQEGTLGLMEAVRRFDPEHGVRLSTYAAWWIRAALQNYVAQSVSLMRAGTSAAQRAFETSGAWLDRSRGAAADGAGEPPPITELPDSRPSPEEAVVETRERRFALGALTQALALLPPRERLIIARRYLAERRLSRAALGLELGLSKERVRQLELRALARLRAFLGELFELPRPA